MVRRLIPAIGQALGLGNITGATEPGMTQWYTRTAASVPIASARNAGRSTIPSCTPVASRVLASKGPRRWRAAANGLSAEPIGDQAIARRGKQSWEQRGSNRRQ